MDNEQLFEQDLLNIIRYSTGLLQDLKNNYLEIHTSDVNKTATIVNQLYNMKSDLLMELPF